MNIGGLVQGLIEDQAFSRLVNDPLAQFGPPEAPYLGATILPERQVPENEYTEEGIRYRSPIANHGTRYSPVQIKESMITGSMRVALGNSDIGAELTGQGYDHMIRLLQRTYGVQTLAAAAGGGVSVPTIQAVTAMLKWADMGLARPLHMRNEVDRWNAIVDGSVIMSGDNNYRETIVYPNPTGHRVNAGGQWSNNSYDPWADFIAMAEFLRSKGYTIGRIITSTPVASILSNNLLIRQRAGYLTITAGIITGLAGRVQLDGLNSLLSKDGLPPIELYDRQYQTQNAGTTTFTTQGVSFTGNWILKRDVVVFICNTGRNEEIDRGDQEPVVVAETIGYTGVGRPAGQIAPGAVVHVKFEDGKPPRVEGEAWQTSLPVIQDPEAFAVIGSIT